MKKLLVIIMAVMLCCGSAVAFTGCASYDYVIGINNFAEFDALKKAEKGFTDTVQEWMDEKGHTVKFDSNNAITDTNNASTIATTLTGKRQMDMILAIATPSATPSVKLCEQKKIPLLYTAVTDPVSALLTESDYVTGTSDNAPNLISSQIELLFKLKPAAKKIGILYCSGETNSVAQADEAITAIKAKNNSFVEKTADAGDYWYKKYTAADQNAVSTVATQMANEVDVVYIPTDNLMADNMGTVANILKQKNINFVVGEGGMVGDGGLASVGVDYYNLGVQTGEMAIKILEGAAVKDVAWEQYSKPLEFFINETTAKAIGMSADDIAAIKSDYAA